jgi:hypothetical protein
MEGIEVEDEEDEGEACNVEDEEAGGCLVGDLGERSGKMTSDSRSMDLLTC